VQAIYRRVTARPWQIVPMTGAFLANGSLFRRPTLWAAQSSVLDGRIRDLDHSKAVMPRM